MEKKYGYARVSTREQNLDRQIAALREYIPDERDIITEINGPAGVSVFA